jgi:hypothetical protein
MKQVNANFLSNNADFLCQDLKFLGFGEDQRNEIMESLETEHPGFEIKYKAKFDGEEVEALLFFTRPDPKGYFFFSKYEMRLGEKTHLFVVFKGKGITLKEAYNLLNGRAVYKTRTARNGQKYSEWMQLDLSMKDEFGFRIEIYPESHGFDLDHAIDELEIETPSVNWDRSMLIRSLEKGNLQGAFIKSEGTLRKVNIQADPKNRTITVHEIEYELVETAEEMKADDVENEEGSKKSRAKKLKDVTV